MKMVSFWINDETLSEIANLTSNNSEFIRQAIDEKLGKKEKSLQEVLVILEGKSLECQTLEDKIVTMIQEKLKQEKELTIAQKEEYENKLKEIELKKHTIIESIKELPEFQTLLSQVKDKPDLMQDSMFLMGFITTLREKYPTLKIGVAHLKEILPSLVG